MPQYEIRRFFVEDKPYEVVTTYDTLEEAMEHCNGDDTHGDGWFDGWTELED